MNKENLEKEIAKGNVSPIAFYNPDGSNMLYTQKYVEQKDKEIERLNNEIKTLLKENSNKEKVIIKQNNIIDKLNKQNIELGEELSLTKDKMNKEIYKREYIINELESYLEQQWLEWKDDYNDEIVAMANEDKAILDKLKELKEGK